MISQIAKPSIRNVAIYLRLSKNDGDKEESESISNQRAIILDFINKNFSYDSYYEYIDDGVSGSTFNRPAFKKMLNELKSNNIDLVITKNLARFGRNYIEAGEYIETLFPNNNIRYIAILDRIDNFEDRVANEFAPIKGVFNELFCKETSKSVKKSKRKKMQEGIYSCNVAPFGYKKDPDNKGKLVIDKVASKIVKRIFELTMEGKSAKKIADIFNKEKILTPSEYLKVKGLENRTKKIWTRSMITRILCNEVYLGKCVRGKTQNISYKSNKRVHIKRNEQIKVDNTHKAIISLEEFEQVHSQKKFGCEQSTNKKIITKFADFMYCGECGHKLAKRRNRNFLSVYCLNNSESNLLCINNKLYKYEDIEITIIKNIQKSFEEYFKENNLNNPQLIKKYNEIKANKFDENIEQLNKELGMIKFKISKLYNDRLQNAITEESYKDTYKKLTEKRKRISDLIKKTEEERDIILNENETIKKLRHIKKILNNLNSDSLSSEDITELIEKILVYHDKIHIFLKFKKIKPETISCKN